MTSDVRGFLVLSLSNRLDRLESLRKQVDRETEEITQLVTELISLAQKASSEEKEWLSPDEAGAILGISGQTVRMHIDDFVHKRVGVRYMVRRDSVERTKGSSTGRESV